MAKRVAKKAPVVTRKKAARPEKRREPVRTAAAPPPPKPARTVQDLCAALEALAPLRLAQEWDNVGLLAGDRAATVSRALLTIDLTSEVIAEALRGDVQFVMAYHPPIFKPISRLTAPGADTSVGVLQCLRAGIALYSTHTALDAADGGTNDVLAELCGLTEPQPFEFTGRVQDGPAKIVAFVPPYAVEKVADALFAAGAGRIGDYEKCSFRSPGSGTFLGGESTNPVAGQSGKYETVQETRLEAVTQRDALPVVVDALRKAHPYEEPAFDIYSLQAVPQRGLGRWGNLAAPTTLAKLAAVLKDATASAIVQLIGEGKTPIRRAAVCAGSAGSWPLKLPLTAGDVVVTGEMRHHDALAILRRGAVAVVLGHWASERPVLAPLAAKIRQRVPDLDIRVSRADRDPFRTP